MPVLSKPSAAARTSLIYITVGAMLDIWSGVWYWYLRNENQEVERWVWYVCAGLLLTGLTLIVLGILVGHIGRSARHAELPPPEVTAAEAKAEQNAAARAPIVAPVPAAGTVAAPGTVQPVAPTANVVPAAPVQPVPANGPTAKVLHIQK